MMTCSTGASASASSTVVRTGTGLPRRMVVSEAITAVTAQSSKRAAIAVAEKPEKIGTAMAPMRAAA